MINFLHWISGPFVGAVIGYFTNYLAVKMLFRPLNEVKVFGKTLPFTPGLIPKRQGDLAKACGSAVGGSLLTVEDLEKVLLSESVENAAAEGCLREVNRMFQREDQVKEMSVRLIGEELYDTGRAYMVRTVTDKAMQGILEIRPGNLIAREGKRILGEKLEGTMFSRLAYSRIMDSAAKEAGFYAERYLTEHAPEFIKDILEKEITAIEEKSLKEAGEAIPLKQEVLEEKIHEVYRLCIVRFAGEMAAKFDIAGTVEAKIREMDPGELEALVMSVMKHELGMIVNLGALIGLVLGIVMLFV